MIAQQSKINNEFIKKWNKIEIKTPNLFFYIVRLAQLQTTYVQ